MRMFLFNDTATTEIYTLSLHDALPISRVRRLRRPGDVEILAFQPSSRLTVTRATASARVAWRAGEGSPVVQCVRVDRKSTRLNSSHANISYAVFCLKKKNLPHSILTSN